MSSNYSYNSLGRDSNRLASQTSQDYGGSQQNISGTGTLNRTQVERRGAQFISARGRANSSDNYLDNDGNSSLRRTAKSQERLNSSSSMGGSRSNLAPQRGLDRSVGGGSRGNLAQQHKPPPAGSGNAHNYSNIPNNVNNDYSPSRENNYNQNFSGNRKILDSNRSSTHSTHSIQSTQSTHSSHNYSTNANNNSTSNTKRNAISDSNFHDFEKIRQELLRQDQLYDDPVFLPNDSTLYYSRYPPFKFEWIRAKEIARMYRQAPKFVSQGFSRFDIRQGQLGDCWFVAAMSCLSSPDHHALIERVIPPGQSFQDGWYAGVFRFCFWHFGQWKQVTVDDYLPTVRGQLCFVNSTQPNEFWGPLMEKAYAKIYGSYESLKSGVLADSLTDVTGGISEQYILQGPDADVPENIVNILFKSLERMSLIGCAINDKGSGEAVLPNGLVAGHAYSVTDLRRILASKQAVNLIRIRNPHGDSKEWRGKWSEWSPEWQQISPSDRERLGLIQRDDGEFWMDFEDFMVNFDSLTICNLSPDSPIDMQRKWHAIDHNGRWTKGYNAGGRPNCEETYYSNPQYLMRLDDVDDDEDNLCSIIVQLMQKDRRKIKQKGEKFLHLGFQIYEYEKGYTVPLKKEFFDHHQRVASSGAYVNARQVSKRLLLRPGEYVLVPSTWEADEEADYYIRFFFEKGNVAEYCDEKPEKSDAATPPMSPEQKDQEEIFKNFFYKISGEDMEVNAFELQEGLNEALSRDPLHNKISIEACKAFVSLMDVDGSGRLNYHEFQYLWNYLRNWKKMFYQYDKNNSGSMNSRELRAAINASGFKVSHRTILSLIYRFSDEYGRISLDNFLALMARLMKSFNIFHYNQKEGTASFSLEQWLDKCLSL